MESHSSKEEGKTTKKENGPRKPNFAFSMNPLRILELNNHKNSCVLALVIPNKCRQLKNEVPENKFSHMACTLNYVKPTVKAQYKNLLVNKPVKAEKQSLSKTAENLELGLRRGFDRNLNPYGQN